MKDPLRRRLRARVLDGVIATGRRLPGGLVEAGIRGVGSLARGTRSGRLVVSNLELAFGQELAPARREEIRRGLIAHTARQARTWLRLSSGAPPDGADRDRGAWIDDAVEVEDSIERLERVLASGRGAIVVTAHLGDWELLCATLRRRGMHGAVVGRIKHRDPASGFWPELRRGYGVETIPQDASPRRLLKVLGKGETLGLLCDLEVRRLDGEFLPFFGRKALTMTAPAALARASGLPLVPVRCVHRDRRYRLSADDPLDLREDLPREEAQLELLSRLNLTYERWIRETPEQWSWHQPRWRTQPGDMEGVPLSGRSTDANLGRQAPPPQHD